MRISDWSSDLCPPDLHPGHPNQAIKGRSLWADARRRLIRNRAAVVSMVVLGLIAALCFAGPWFVPYELGEVFWDSFTAPPSGAHWMGTDANGRDLTIRVLHGGRISLMVGLVATRSEEHTSELQSLMRISYAVFCLTKK